MKKIYLLLLSLMYWSVENAMAQYQIRIENEKLVNSTTYDFDVMFYATSGTFEFGSSTLCVNYNTAWRNGNLATMSAAIVSGSSQLSNSNQIPNAAVNLVTDGLIRLNGRITPGAGLGSIITTAGVRYITIRITCSGGFTAGQIPRLRFKLDAAPSQSLNVYLGITLTAVISSTTISSQVNALNPIYWNGTSWEGFAFNGITAGAGTTLTSPSSSQDANIMGNLTATGNISARSLSIQSGSTLTMGSNTLEVGHQFNNYGTINLSGSTLTLSGNTDATKNQSLSIGTVTLNNLNFQGGGTKTLNSLVNITGTVTGSGTTILNANGKLVLKSDNTGTARIAELPAGSTISGNISVERYIPGNKRSRLLSSPVVGATAEHWRNFGVNTAGIGFQITGTGGAANGFDVSLSNNPSAYSYNETSGNPSLASDPGWTGFTTGTMTLNSGEGYRVRIRGDRTINLTIDDPNLINTTITVTGTNPSSSITKNLSFTGSNGWNLLGNPYPSPISWNNLTKTGAVDGSYYTFNTSGNSYVSWNGSVGGAGNIIHSSQGFFVRATGSGASITFEESDKVSGNGGFFGKKAATNLLEIKLEFDSSNYDQMFVHFTEDASNGWDKYDALKLTNPIANISSIDESGNSLTINSLKYTGTIDRIIPISLDKTANSSNYSLHFKNVESFSNQDIYWVDKVLNQSVKITEGRTITLSLLDAASKQNGRYELQFKPKLNSTEDLSFKPILKVFPNPVKDNLTLQWNETIAKEEKQIEIFDNKGALIMQKTSHDELLSTNIPFQDMSDGIYFIRVAVLDKVMVFKIVK